eukprot:s3096_g2.t1
MQKALIWIESRAEVRLWHHAVQTAQDVYHLPPWTQAPDDVPKEPSLVRTEPEGYKDTRSPHFDEDKRLLQHIALRVSLEDGRDLPWTHAARAVEAWDAELFLAKGATDSQTQGLRSFSDDIVFLHLTMAFLADECLVPLLLPPTTVMDSGGSTPIASAPASPLSACVFDASHPVHAWSFLVCDLAEAQEVETNKKKAGGGTPLQRFLASAWCSPTLVGFLAHSFKANPESCDSQEVCDTASWRGAGGRRVLLPYTVYKVYRQLRSSELDLLRRAALDCIIMQANSPQASLRKTAMRALSELVDMDISVLTLRSTILFAFRMPVEETVDMRLRDESSWVRQVTLDLLGRILEGSLSTEVTPRLLSMESSEATAKAMLLRFHKTGLSFNDCEIGFSTTACNLQWGLRRRGLSCSLEFFSAGFHGLSPQFDRGDILFACKSLVSVVSMRAADEDGILDGTFKDGQTERNDSRMIRIDSEIGILDGECGHMCHFWIREVASNLVGSMPLPGVEKEAHDAYRVGLNAQTSGDLQMAVRSTLGRREEKSQTMYAQALRLESDPYDRSYILYNLGLCFAENGEYSKAAKYYLMADQNYELCSAWNNLGVLFHAQGMKAEGDFRSERADALFAKAAERVNDTAVIVRRQATKILSAFVLNHPDHPDVIPVTLDLLRRSTDSEALRNLVMGTFELLWFMDDEPTPEAAPPRSGTLCLVGIQSNIIEGSLEAKPSDNMDS